MPDTGEASKDKCPHLWILQPSQHGHLQGDDQNQDQDKRDHEDEDEGWEQQQLSVAPDLPHHADAASPELFSETGHGDGVEAPGQSVSDPSQVTTRYQPGAVLASVPLATSASLAATAAANPTPTPYRIDCAQWTCVRSSLRRESAKRPSSSA